MKGASSARGITLDAQKLRDLRRQRGMTQAHLAEAAGMISDDPISRAERGIPISLDNAAAIAAVFNVIVASLTVAVAEIEAPAASNDSPAGAASNIPIRVPAHFMGREDALADIETAMGRHNGRVAITALHGLRGVGKTVLAAAYAERHRRDYRATWWLRAETEAGMRADLVGLGVRLGWVGPDDKEEPALTTVSERLGHEGDGILLIFDNAVDADSLVPYLPRGRAARVLVTSNYHAWRGTAEPVQIRLWPKEIGADYLISRTGRDGERKAAGDLSVALGGLPLAHEQAAAYCERLDLSLAEYARRFAAEPARLLDTDKDAPAEYHDKLTVAKTFALAIEAAAKLHPAAEPLIAHAALLVAEPIPLFLFCEEHEKFGEPLSSLFAGDGLGEAVAALRAFALVDREMILDERDPAITTDTIRLHRLVREVAAARRTGDAREAARRALIEATASAFPHGVDHDPNTWPRARRLDSLAIDLVSANVVQPIGIEGPVCYLMTFLAAYRYRAVGDYVRTLPLLERALTIYEKAFGSEHPNTATTVTVLAMMLEAKDDRASAQPLYERALTIREKALGPDHPDTASSLDNLATCLFQQGDVVASRRLLKRASKIREKVLGPDHPTTARGLSNLALVLSELDEFTSARPLFERALAISEKMSGPGHPDTAMVLYNLARLHRSQGDLALAQPLYERALAICEGVLGPMHPNTAMARENLAALIAECG
jgi:tetratricopeptide (TPR) repeat protein/transcriptional regulator with XRE-family HTH domain